MISIICATFNASSCIDNFLKSIQNQSSDNFELIIIDGKSTDNTMEIVASYSDIVTQQISEPDKGIYDAWNKGIKLSKTPWICFVGADDILKPEFVEVYTDFLKNNDTNSIDYISSIVNYIDTKGNTLLKIGKPWKWKEFKYRMTTAHVGSLHNRNLFDEVGNYNLDYKIIGDYELLLRKKARLRTHFIAKELVYMQAGGISLSKQALKERFYAQKNTAGVNLFISTCIYFIGLYCLNKIVKKI